jgi:hypothetical protein
MYLASHNFMVQGSAVDPARSFLAVGQRAKFDG